MRITVVGTGYVGLVVGTCFAETGNVVVCVDKDSEKISTLTRGEIPIFEPGLGELVARNMAEERLRFSNDLAEAVRDSEIVFIAVGTPQDVDGSADMRYVLEVAEGVGRAMNEGTIIVLKSTVPVGTAERVRRTIEKTTRHSFAVVSNPEFLKEGVAIDDFMRPDRVVIGTKDARAEEIMRRLYEPFLRTGNPILVMDHASAELSKYAANAMLATRISFMNEIANLCDRVGADVWHVRQGLATDRRIGSAFLFPGMGYGGSCFPKDVSALIRMGHEAGHAMRVTAAVREANEAQKTILVSRINERLGGLRGRVVAVWGLAFKPRTDDVREAPAIALIEALLEQGAAVHVYDPVALETAKIVLGQSVTYHQHAYDALDGADALVVATEWNEFRRPDFERMKAMMRRPCVFDGRDVFDPDQLEGLGFIYEGIGRR
ncbi:MAG: UDP-glucose/GDP-mannose dehydrogenase family protein [Vicinamibacteria bacterium]|nr:UDP-glucose/GDP-mannose dehydrogenase family protein [Vicinamibacteria bacterium]